MLNRPRKTILISYRRADTGAVAGHLAEKLKQKFGQAQVFIDVDNIPFGVDFRKHIKGVMHKCDTVLVLLGRHWAGAAGDSTRIREPADSFRIEIETALALGLHVIPVLVDRAEMPTAADLPPSLEDFAFLNAASLDVGRDFRTHSDRIAEAIQRFHPDAPIEGPANHPAWARAALLRPLLLPATDWAVSAAMIIVTLFLMSVAPSIFTSSIMGNPFVLSATITSIVLTTSLLISKIWRLSSILPLYIAINTFASLALILCTWPLVLKPEASVVMIAYFPSRIVTLILIYVFSGRGAQVASSRAGGAGFAGFAAAPGPAASNVD